MKKYILLSAITIALLACTSQQSLTNQKIDTQDKSPAEIVLAFGSCNRTDLPNNLWDDILQDQPDVWIWGGDVIYADTENMNKMQQMYQDQLADPGYANMIKNIPVIGTWDDHDYGLNDGGEEYPKRVEAQQLFHDFIGIDKSDAYRQIPGVYTAYDIAHPKGKVSIYVLDTRYFRSKLTPDPAPNRRYQPSTNKSDTMLGAAQWKWLEQELKNSNATFHVFISSIQFLSGEHGFERWATMPHEMERLEQLLTKYQIPNAMILSGDRHISEFSQKNLPDLGYPLIDFTSSGLTHVYQSFSGEPNRYRTGEVVNKLSYGLVRIHMETKKVQFLMRGNQQQTYQQLEIQYQ
ncbi:MAG: alkaline phosphatase family protein [Flavobacteriaceae bacterium]|nr:alkaline phosphatase family protein [Flavobacteriaceae bacterium]